MVSLKLSRTDYQARQTLGKYNIMDDGRVVGSFDCLELPWLGNKSGISCIPTGIYQVEKRFTPEKGWHFHILDVPRRTWILIHAGNFHTQIKGCQLPGMGLADINGDGDLDVTASRKALSEMLRLLPSSFEMEIS